jgi:hypothetical protein
MFQSYPLPAHIAHQDIASAVVIGYPLESKHRTALTEVGAVLLLKYDREKILQYDPDKRAQKLPNLVCMWHGLPEEQIKVAKQAFGVDRVLVTQSQECLVEMLVKRHPSSKMRRLSGKKPGEES